MRWYFWFWVAAVVCFLASFFVAYGKTISHSTWQEWLSAGLVFLTLSLGVPAYYAGRAG